MQPGITEESRLLELGPAALSEALAGAEREGSGSRRMGLVLVTPQEEERPRGWRFPGPVLEALLARLPRTHPGPAPLLVPGGHAGFVPALDAAARLLARRQVDACVVGAVDTLCTARTLEHLDRLHRLRNPQQDEEPIPGEAAAFVVLEPRSTGRATRASAACVAWAASAMEPGEKRSVPGTHLTRAVQECLHRSDTPKVTPGLILSDMGGRKQEALHLAFARIRAFPDQAYAARLVHPAESLGDVGAATGPLLMVLATLFQRAASGSQPHALLTTETREQHGAACLIAPERK